MVTGAATDRAAAAVTGAAFAVVTGIAAGSGVAVKLAGPGPPLRGGVVVRLL